MSPTVAPARRFKPVSLGLMFFSMGLALAKIDGLTTLSEPNRNFNIGLMYCSFIASGICVLLFILCIIKREILDWISNRIQPWAYTIGTIYLSVFMINWLLNLPDGGTPIFRYIFYLGLVWFSLLLVILLSSLSNNIKFIGSGIFWGLGIPSINRYLSTLVSSGTDVSLLNSQDFYVSIFMWAMAVILFFIARRDCNLMEHFPI